MNLNEKAKDIRRKVLDASYQKKMGHLGGTYSCIDILVALYYDNIIRINYSNLKNNNRDRFILSKGHACLALYAIFLDLGIINYDLYESYHENGGLGAQLDIKCPGVDWNTGSLGHSIGVCCGLSLAARIDESNRRILTLIGDAECAEGSIWESIVFAGQHKLNIIVIVDRNRMSVIEKLGDESFFKSYPIMLKDLDWDYYEINGHDFGQIVNTLKICCNSLKPSMIIANTIKGKGVSFMEDKINWHHGVPSDDQYKRAMIELL